MTLYLGKHEITNQFSLDYTSELSGVIGLRLIEHTTIRWSDRFRVTSDHDNVRLQCIVTVPGLGSNISTVKIRVRCKYDLLFSARVCVCVCCCVCLCVCVSLCLWVGVVYVYVCLCVCVV